MEGALWRLWTEHAQVLADSLQPFTCMTTNFQCVTVQTKSCRHHEDSAPSPLETIDFMMKEFPLLGNLQPLWILILVLSPTG